MMLRVRSMNRKLTLLVLITLMLAAQPSLAAPQPTANEAAAPKMDLNTASPEQLQGLPGVGDATAKKIVAGRPYKSVDDLLKAGVPKATVEKIRPMVTAQAPAGKPASTSAKVDVNTASAEQLKELPGIGEGYAGKIVAGRPYKSVDDLVKAGIPRATVEKIKPMVTVEQPGGAAQTPPKAGMVWANPDSMIYHKAGSQWYGKTKDGKWMTEQEAVRQGYRPAK